MTDSDFDERIINILGKCDDICDASTYYDELKEISKNIKADPTNKFLHLIFEVLGSEDRLLILQFLAKKDRCACELEGLLQKSQPAVSRDIKKLEEVNLIQGWKKGKFIHYSLIKPTFDLIFTNFQGWFKNFDNWFGFSE